MAWWPCRTAPWPSSEVGRPRPPSSPAALPGPGPAPKRRLSPVAFPRSAPRTRGQEGRSPLPEPSSLRASVCRPTRLSPPLLPPRRSLLLAAERQEPADHQPPPNQRRLGHPVPHRCRLLQVQLRWQDLLHQGGERARREAAEEVRGAAQLEGGRRFREAAPPKRSRAVLSGRVARFVEKMAFSSGAVGLKLCG